MNIIWLIIGIAIGWLLDKTKLKTIYQSAKDELISEKIQFVEPVQFKEKFEQSKSLNDLLNG